MNHVANLVDVNTWL